MVPIIIIAKPTPRSIQVWNSFSFSAPKIIAMAPTRPFFTMPTSLPLLAAVQGALLVHNLSTLEKEEDVVVTVGVPGLLAPSTFSITPVPPFSAANLREHLRGGMT